MDMRQIAGFFASAAYIGNSIYETGHDRLWHFGKCSQPVPVVYGKPLKAPWARGALYYLSAQALERLSSHYLRFPGCLAGELYEDKAVGNVLYDQGVLFSAHRLENLLGLGSESPERA